MPTYLDDALTLALQRTAKHPLQRRRLLQALAAIGLTAAPGAHAADRRLVVCNWGGDALKYQPEAWGKPFEAASGITVEFDGSGPSFGKIRAMEESSQVTWDVCDTNLAAALNLGRRGYLEKIDYTIVDRSKVRPGFSNDWGVSHFVYSFVLAYDRTKFGKSPPRSWADFWNTRDFPGMRTLPDRTLGALEGALMADGAAAQAAALYPMDEHRALEKIRAIKDQTIFWKTATQSQQLLRQGEVSMGMLWHTRAVVLKRDPDASIDFTWNQGVLIPAGWLVPKHNPGGRAVFDFIAATQDPKSQVELLRLMGNGPANPAADALVPPDLRADNPTDPDNLRLQVTADPEWIAANQDRVYEDYVKVITG